MSFEDQFINSTTLRFKFLSEIPHRILYPEWLTPSNEHLQRRKCRHVLHRRTPEQAQQFISGDRFNAAIVSLGYVIWPVHIRGNRARRTHQGNPSNCVGEGQKIGWSLEVIH